MPYKDPEVRKIKAAERNAKRWARIKEDPLLLSAYRSARTECERRRRHTARRKALKLKQFIEDVAPNIVYTMHGGMCGICKEFIEGEFHVDHVIPLSKGGMHGYVNVQPAHPACNWSKGNRG